jgi:hypothetical protein
VVDGRGHIGADAGGSATASAQASFGRHSGRLVADERRGRILRKAPT